MNVYLAGPYQWKDQIGVCAKELETLGVNVTSSWLAESHAPHTQLVDLPSDVTIRYAVADLRDIDRADAFVLFAVPAEDVPIPRAGRHVEFGYALARGIPIHVVGDVKENIFHYLPGRVRHYATWRDMMDYFAGHPCVMGI